MEWLQVLSALALVFGLLGLFYWMAARYGSRPMRSGARRIEVLERRSLGDRSQLVLVQIGEDTFLLGATSQSVTLLSQVDLEPQPAGAESVEKAEAPRDFCRWLELLK
jgi:flagellar biosynthetic protein FliO